MAAEPERPQKASDAYESQYMKDGAALLHRDKTVWRYHFILLLPLLLTLGVNVVTLAGMGSKPAPLSVGLLTLIPTFILALSWILFSVLRVHVTADEVHIQYGVFGPRIPVSAIEDCKVIDYDVFRFGGWGIRRGVDGTWAYSLLGEGSRVVEIAWREGGALKKVVVSSRDPETLSRAIQRARLGAQIGNRIVIGEGTDALAKTLAVESTEPAADRQAAAELEAAEAEAGDAKKRA